MEEESQPHFCNGRIPPFRRPSFTFSFVEHPTTIIFSLHNRHIHTVHCALHTVVKARRKNQHLLGTLHILLINFNNDIEHGANNEKT